MKKLFIYICLSVCFLTSLQASNYKFSHFSMEDGLSDNHVQTIYEDSKGYLWIGTKYFITRYDGYEFKIYGKDKFDANTLSANVISDIYERKNEDLLFATEEGGLFKLNRDLDRFERYHDNLLASPQLQRIFEDQEGRLWIGYADGKGVERWNKDLTGKESVIGTASYVNDIYEDSGHTVWMSCDNGLFACNLNSGQKNVYERGKTIIAVVEWNADFLLVGTNENGLFLMKKSTGEPLNNDITRKLTGEKFYNDLINRNGIKVKAVLKKGNFIWIGTTEGLYCYSIDINNAKELTYFNSDENQKEGLSHPIITCLGMSKKSDVLWIGLLHSGMNKLNINKPVFIHRNREEPTIFAHAFPRKNFRLSENSINAISEDQKSIWVGFESGGINELDKKTGALQDSFPDLKKELKNSSITGIVDYPDSILLFTWEGDIFSLNKQTRAHRKLNYKKPEKIRFWHAIKDHKGDIWIAASGDGVYKIEKDSLREIIPGENKCWYLLEDGNILWVGTQNGLLRYVPSTGEKTLYQHQPDDLIPIPENYIDFIAKAENANQLWVATYGGGACLFDKSSAKVLFCYNEENGLPSNVVQSLGLDKKQNLWIATENGLCVIRRENLNKKNPGIIVFNESRGIQSMQYQTRAFCKGSDGTLYFGGINGLNIITGSEIDSIKIDSLRLMITGFQLIDENGMEITGDDKNFIQRAISQDTDRIHIELKSGQRISFTVAVIDYLFNRGYQYSYSIKKAKDTTSLWQPIDKKRIINLVNLSSGNYILRIKAETSDGRHEGIKDIFIRIIPAFRETGWFFLLVILGLLVVFVPPTVLLIHYLSKKKEKELNLAHNTIPQIQSIEELESINPQLAIQKLLAANDENLKSFLKMDRIKIGLLNETGDRLIFFPLKEDRPSFELFPDKEEDRNNPCVLCYKKKEEVYIKNNKNSVEKGYSPDDEKVVNSILCLPLKDKNGQKNIGVITLQAFRKNAFNAHRRELFRIVSQGIEKTLANISGNIKTVEDLALSDTRNSIMRHQITPILNEHIPEYSKELGEEIKAGNKDEAIESFVFLNQWIIQLRQIINNIFNPELTFKKFPFICSTFQLKEISWAMKIYENSPNPAVHFRFDVSFTEFAYAVRGSKLLIEILLQNLIENAFKNTTDGEITVSASDFDDKFVKISVKDTGRGLDAQAKNDLFKVGNSAKGHGFGLIICQNIIKLHNDNTLRGCRIWVEDNEEGKGCTFHFTIAKANN